MFVDDNFVRIFHRRRVLRGQIRQNLGAHVAAMARVTGDGAHSAEVVLVDFVHHRHHPAGRYLQWRLVGKLFPGADAFRDMAVDAVQAEGGGKHSHRVHEFVYGNPFENIDFLENFFRHRLSLRLRRLPGLTVCQPAISRHATDEAMAPKDSP